MHRFFMLLIAALLAGGCAGPQDKKEQGKSSAAAKPVKAPPKPAPIIEPVSAFSGKVVLVNVPLKYIVIEGTIGRLPPMEQLLNVYRDGQKVGVVVVSSQTRGNNFAADISQGDARVGDTVRSD